MSKHRPMRCESCGSTHFKPHPNNGLWVCEYCGAMTEAGQSTARKGPVQSGSQSMRLVIFLVSSLLLVAVIVFNMYFPRGWLSGDYQPEPVVDSKPAATSALESKSVITVASDTTSTSQSKVSQDPQWVSQHLIIDHQVTGTTRNGGRFWIFELLNQAKEDMLRPGVTVSLFDAEGQRLAEQSGWAYQQRLQAGEKTQLMVFIDEPPAAAAAEAITPMASQTTFMADNQIAIAVKNHIINEKNGHYEIIGDVINDQTTAVQFPRVVVVAQDADGRAIGLGQSFSTQKSLDPDAISGFKVRVGTFLVGEPVNWHVYALAQKP